MELSLRTRAVEVTDALHDLVTRRLELALDIFEDRIGETSVYLMDLNGPRGGVDKLCQISVRVSGIGDVVVRETGTTLPAAINRAARRLKYRIAETLRQSSESSTESIRKPAAA
jgi:putative sigma-54 modulation protein